LTYCTHGTMFRFLALSAAVLGPLSATATELQTDWDDDGSTEYCPLPSDKPNPCAPDNTDYCCDWDCTYCGSAEYCETQSPFKRHSGQCNPRYQPAPGTSICGNHYVPCLGPYCRDEPKKGENPCRSNRKDYCCEYQCDYCGPKDFCENFAPSARHSGVCNPDHKREGWLCKNYYRKCSSRQDFYSSNELPEAGLRGLEEPNLTNDLPKTELSDKSATDIKTRDVDKNLASDGKENLSASKTRNGDENLTLQAKDA